MKCLLDMDGVLVDFVRGSCETHNRSNPYPEFDKWDIKIPWKMESKEFWEPMGRDFWANLNWTEDGPAILESVEARFGPENVCLLTSPCATEGCIDGKMDWIKANMPAYKRRFLVGPAKEFCANPMHVMVDDNDDNVLKFTQAGGWAILVPRPWNANREQNTMDYVQKTLKVI